MSQIDDSFEVVIVDNLSSDGSQHILDKYQEGRVVRVLRKRCNRGRGRQIGLEHSLGSYVISNLDMDDVFRPFLPDLLELYHAKSEGNLLHVRTNPADREGWGSNTTIAPRKLLLELGGWRPLQFYEDWDLWSRAARRGLYQWTKFTLVLESNTHRERKSSFGRVRFRYSRYVDMSRLGRKIFSDGESVSPAQRLIGLAARARASLSRSWGDELNRSFDPFDSRYYLAT